MEKRIFRWKYLIFAICIIAVVFLAAFWDAVILRVVPKAVLSKSLTTVCTKLQERFEGSPLNILYKLVEPEGKYTANVLLCTSNSLLGKITYDMDIQTELAGHRFQAQGDVISNEMRLNLSCYLDDKFLAVASQDMADGQYYGLTYESFTTDICSIPLLNFLVSDELLRQWNSSIENIQQKVSQTSMPHIPALSEDDWRTLTLGILALPCKVETVAIATEGESWECQAVVYSLQGEQVNHLLADTSYSKDPVVAVTFYLYEGHLVKILLDCTSENNHIQCGLFLGLNPVEDVLHMNIYQQNGNDIDSFSVSIDTVHSGTLYSETWSISNVNQLQYDYQTDTGDISLIMNDEDSVSLKIIELNKGVFLESEDFQQIFHILIPNVNLEAPLSGTLTVTRGSEFSTPSYKNLSQWSLDDFWVLLNSVGLLVGIKLS